MPPAAPTADRRPKTADRSRAARMPEAAGDPRRVLIVEDDTDGRDALVQLCRRTGHTCLSAATRAEALAILISQPPDAIVLDLMLPDGSGLEVLRVVRTHHFPVRVAVVTAASDPRLLAEVRALHPDVLFRKPLDFADLRRWLDGKS